MRLTVEEWPRSCPTIATKRLRSHHRSSRLHRAAGEMRQPTWRSQRTGALTTRSLAVARVMRDHFLSPLIDSPTEPSPEGIGPFEPVRPIREQDGLAEPPKLIGTQAGDDPGRRTPGIDAAQAAAFQAFMYPPLGGHAAPAQASADQSDKGLPRETAGHPGTLINNAAIRNGWTPPVVLPKLRAGLSNRTRIHPCLRRQGGGRSVWNDSGPERAAVRPLCTPMARQVD